MSAQPTVILHTDRSVPALEVLRLHDPDLAVHPCDSYAALPELIGKTGEAIARHTHAIGHDDAGHPRPTEIDAGP